MTPSCERCEFLAIPQGRYQLLCIEPRVSRGEPVCIAGDSDHCNVLNSYAKFREAISQADESSTSHQV